jgi:glycosyltransferase involved in cell wall biosynthesis
MPKISFCVPCGPGHIEHLTRSLHYFNKQTSRDFEVVICYDDFDGPSQPFDFVKTTSISRAEGKEALPHRNHARNAAAKLATGEYLWFWDADVLPEDCLVAHAIAVLTPHISICPAMFQIAPPRGQDWPDVGVDALLNVCRIEDAIFPNTGHRHLSIRIPTLDDRPQPISEGYPCVHRKVYDLLEGFDEAYLGWGRNKEEFVMRLNTLRPLHHYRLIRTARAFVQTHKPDESKKDHHTSFHNDKRYKDWQATFRKWGPPLRERYKECVS